MATFKSAPAIGGHGGGHSHGHGQASRLHEDLPHYSEFHIKHPSTILYHITFAALLFLLVVTVILYSLDLSHIIPIVGINLIVALIVAVIKAYLVVRNFMNVKGGTSLIFMWAALGFIWLVLMGGIFIDYRTRPEIPGWQKVEYTVQNASTNNIETDTHTPEILQPNR